MRPVRLLAALLVAVAPLSCGKRLVAKAPLAQSITGNALLKGQRMKVPEVTPVVFMSGNPAAFANLNRVVVFEARPSRHGTVAPNAFALENAVMWSGRVPVAPAIGVLDGRKELSDIERILRTRDLNKVDLILQIDSPLATEEPLVPCTNDSLCLTSMLQVEQMKNMACAPSGALPSLPVLSVEARVIRVSDARVVAVARVAMVAPVGKQIRRFADPSVAGACRFVTFEKPKPYADYHACCQAILDTSQGRLRAEGVCPDLLECKQITPMQAFQRLETISVGNRNLDACKYGYGAEEIKDDASVPKGVPEAIFMLEQAAVHALLGGPKAPNPLPPTVTAPVPATPATTPSDTLPAPPPPPRAISPSSTPGDLPEPPPPEPKPNKRK